MFSAMVPTTPVETAEQLSADCFPFPRNPHFFPTPVCLNFCPLGHVSWPPGNATWQLPSLSIQPRGLPIPSPLFHGSESELLNNSVFVLVNFPRGLYHSLSREECSS